MQVNPLITVNIFIVSLQKAQRHLQTKQLDKRIHKKKLQKQFAGSRRNNKKSNHKLSTNVKQPPTRSSLHYLNHKPEQKSCITKTLPSCSLDQDNQTLNNHIKPLKPKHPNPSIVHYPTQSPLKKTRTTYAQELVTLAVALH